MGGLVRMGWGGGWGEGGWLEGGMKKLVDTEPGFCLVPEWLCSSLCSDTSSSQRDARVSP